MGDIADEHYDRMMWETGNPWIMENNPFCDTPDFGGWRNYLLRHQHDDPETRRANAEFLAQQGYRLSFTFRCHYCKDGITFINRRPFDQRGPHRCLAEKRGTIPEDERIQHEAAALMRECQAEERAKQKGDPQ